MGLITTPEKLAVPAVSLLIIFLSYSSQFLFHYLDPGPLGRRESVTFNVLVACIWICYYRACTVDPAGRRNPTTTTSDDKISTKEKIKDDDGPHESSSSKPLKAGRWCKKCALPKPERAHHCKTCRTCVPKMDHHCPWTTNCVSHTTQPHFLRFLSYAVTSMALLSYFIWQRLLALWDARHLPSYLGPSLPALVHLMVLTLTNALTLFALGVLLIRSGMNVFTNTTTIEGWEVSRHQALVRRARLQGGYVDGQDGQRVLLQRREFPFDIGFWSNLVQAFGTRNVVAWGWPFARTIRVPEGEGYRWERNGFEDEDFEWPPPDPDRLPRREVQVQGGVLDEGREGEDWVKAFRERQEADLVRWRGGRVLGEVEGSDDEEGEEVEEEEERGRRRVRMGPERGGADDVLGRGWRNEEGERLDDFGVDEDEVFE